MKKITKIDPCVVTSYTKKKIKVAAYCRVSTASDEQLESLIAQKQHYEKIIKENSDWEFAGLYYDEGVTGTKKEKRKGLQSLLTACELKQIDLIIVKSISRFSRNTLDCLEMVRKLIELGVYLYFEKENLNTGSMDSELILSILSSMAQDESTSISENSKWGIRSRFKQGTYKVSYPPFGYRNVKGTMEVVPEEAEIVRRIYSESLQGKGSYTIARELNETNTPAKKGGKWTGTSVGSILANEKYTGDALFQKTYTDSEFNRHVNRGQEEQYLVTNHHEAIICHEDFNAVQKVINQRGSEKSVDKGNSKYLNRYVLSGKIVCGQCGGHFKRRTHYKKQLSYTAWTCQVHIEDKEKCTLKFINEDSLHHAFIIMMNKLGFGYKAVLKPFYTNLKSIGKSDRFAELSDLDKRIEKNNSRKRVITELVGKGFLDATLFAQELSEIAAEAELLKQEKKRYESMMVGNNDHLIQAERLMQFFSKGIKIEQFDEDLFERFVDEIIVYSRDEVGFSMKCGLILRERLVK